MVGGSCGEECFTVRCRLTPIGEQEFAIVHREVVRECAGHVSVTGIRSLVEGAMTRRFKVGDRVRARTSASVPAGTFGCISMSLVVIVDAYYVQFDGEHSPTLMREDNLELVTDAPADEDAS